jgi:NAD(P)-dependent dehydrogenase (short-subunit alcohol dehydrogenase family)
VLVTGASTGIGAATARELAGRGFTVFAGVRDPADGERLAATIGPRCVPLRLDVTDAASIASAAETIRTAGGIYGLVNNAGIAVTAPLEFVPIEDLRRQFEVNVFGAVAVTRAMLPLLRRSLGRIVNVGSIGGRSALPIAGPYGASKAALHVLTQSLRMELAPFDIGVSYIEPGSHRTAIWERGRRAADTLATRMPPACDAYYGSLIAAMRALSAQAEHGAADPANVARAIAHALESPRPRLRYTVGRDTRALVILGLLPMRWRERAIARRLAATARR